MDRIQKSNREDEQAFPRRSSGLAIMNVSDHDQPGGQERHGATFITQTLLALGRARVYSPPEHRILLRTVDITTHDTRP